MKKAATKTAGYVAARGVSWRQGDGWVDREAGEAIDDAPASAIEEWLALDEPAAATADAWAATAASEEANGDGEA